MLIEGAGNNAIPIMIQQTYSHFQIFYGMAGGRHRRDKMA
jgi:hypothetical protein